MLQHLHVVFFNGKLKYQKNINCLIIQKEDDI